MPKLRIKDVNGLIDRSSTLRKMDFKLFKAEVETKIMEKHMLKHMQENHDLKQQIITQQN